MKVMHAKAEYIALRPAPPLHLQSPTNSPFTFIHCPRIFYDQKSNRTVNKDYDSLRCLRTVPQYSASELNWARGTAGTLCLDCYRYSWALYPHDPSEPASTNQSFVLPHLLIGNPCSSYIPSLRPCNHCNLICEYCSCSKQSNNFQVVVKGLEARPAMYMDDIAGSLPCIW